MEKMKSDNIIFFDENFKKAEQFPRSFTLKFNEVGINDINEVSVLFNCERQLGDVINDNSYENDFYRYHDIFHYTFATLLGWSPCARAMMKRKRKSNLQYDRVEDGARAIITEEAISIIIFNEAKRKKFFSAANSKVSKTTLKIIKGMTENFEVRIRSVEEWENAIKKSYEMFRLLIKNKGGYVQFDAVQHSIKYFPL